MIILTLKAKAVPENCGELLQSLTTMLEHVRKLKGCLNCHCYRNDEDDCEFCFVEKWSIQEHLDTHMRSDLYSAIQGAFKVLSEQSEIEVTRVEDTTDSSLLPSGKP